MSVLIYGHGGWIGGMIVEELIKRNILVIKGKSRIENLESVKAELAETHPERVINCAGVSGVPNVDWCEDHKIETIKGNVVGALSLAVACNEYPLGTLHLTHINTGCIFNYDQDHPIGGKGFTEDDRPNFTGSVYSETRGYTENMLRMFPKVLILRFRMPVSPDLHPKSLVSKLIRYERVINIPNSISVLHTIIPIAVDLSIKEKTGVYNMVNKDAISHNEILELYREIVDPTFTWKNFTEEEQSKVVKVPRSNNFLETNKLEQVYSLPTSHLAVKEVMLSIKHLKS